MKFSERYGYVKPSDAIITERLTPEIETAICNSYVVLLGLISKSSYRKLERYIQRYCLDRSIENIPLLSFLDSITLNMDDNYKHSVILTFIKSSEEEYYKKMDIIETTLDYLNTNDNINAAEAFVNEINTEFTRLNFGYRIVDNYVIKTTSEKEVESIENALKSSSNNVGIHIESALKALSKRPIGDYRNSIKESISAVEALNREVTGENTLNLKKMKINGLIIPTVLRKAFELLYGYSNDAETGIRHALMGENSDYVPGADEALYMLITCSAFINYLNSKLKPETNNHD